MSDVRSLDGSSVLYNMHRRISVLSGATWHLSRNDFEAIISENTCDLCNANITPETAALRLHDPTKGYTKSNTLACCESCQTVEFDNVHRPTGHVSIEKIIDSNSGKEVPFEKALKYGWIKPGSLSCDGYGSESNNLFLDQGRQLVAFCFGFRAPITNYTLQKYGVGTGVTAAKVTDVALESPVTLDSTGAVTANIDSIDYLSSFVLRVSMTLAAGDANGYSLTEFGLYSGNGSLIARKVRSIGIDKISDFSPVLTWRIRF